MGVIPAALILAPFATLSVGNTTFDCGVHEVSNPDIYFIIS